MKFPRLPLPAKLRFQLTPRLKAVLRYAALGVLAFLVFLYLTFPYEAVQQRIESEARVAGYVVKMGSLGPGFFGVTASKVRVSKNALTPEGAPGEPLLIDSLSLRPTLLPPGVSVRADLCGGSVSGSVGGTSDASINVRLSRLNLAQGNLKAFSGVDMDGILDGQLAMELPATATEGKNKVPNLAEGTGNVSLSVTGFTIKGGTVTVPMYGTPTPMDLPRLALGNVDVAVQFDKGQGTLDRVGAKGGDLELQVAGTLKLARQLEYAEPNLTLKVKPEGQAMKGGIIGMGINALPPDPASPDFRAARVTGFLGRPNFVPGA